MAAAVFSAVPPSFGPSPVREQGMVCSACLLRSLGDGFPTLLCRRQAKSVVRGISEGRSRSLAICVYTFSFGLNVGRMAYLYGKRNRYLISRYGFYNMRCDLHCGVFLLYGLLCGFCCLSGGRSSKAREFALFPVSHILFFHHI